MHKPQNKALLTAGDDADVRACVDELDVDASECDCDSGSHWHSSQIEAGSPYHNRGR
jgi:hypothetical protein